MTPDHSVGRWIMGGVLGILAILGLYMASRATDEHFYVVGLLLAFGCTTYIFVMIVRAFNEADRRRREQHDEGGGHHA